MSIIGTPLLIAHNNLVDSATITASSAATKFPANNVKTTFRQVRWRSTGVTSQYLRFSFGSPQNFGALILLDHNFTTTATVNFYGSNDNFVTTDLLSPIFVEGNPTVYYGGDVQYSAVEVTIDDPDNTDGYLSIGRVFIGQYITCFKNYDYGFVIEPVDLSEVVPSANGVDHINIKPIYKKIPLAFTYVNDEQKEEMEAAANGLGIYKPFFVTLDLDNAPYASTYYVRFEVMPKYTNIPPRLWAYELLLEEEL